MSIMLGDGSLFRCLDGFVDSDFVLEWASGGVANGVANGYFEVSTAQRESAIESLLLTSQ